MYFTIHLQALCRQTSTSFNKYINEDQNSNLNFKLSDSYPPNFKHDYHPIAPGYSITARSLSTKFREELK